MTTNLIIRRVMDAAFRVHRVLGPGLLESSYEACVAFELVRIPLRFERQRAMPLVYEGHRLDCGYRIDLLVERKVVVEVKAVEKLLPVHTAQVLTYMRLGGFEAGLLFNFNAHYLKDGMRRLVLNYSGPRPSEVGGQKN